MLFLIILLLAFPVGAEFITLESQGEVTYTQELLTAQGEVQLEYRGTTLYGDHLLLNLEEEFFILEGRVRVAENGQEFEGQTLHFDYARGEGRLLKARGVVTDENIKGNLYIQGARVEFGEDWVKITGGSMTTCDLNHPHYSLRFGEVTIYMEDKMVIRGMTFVESGIPIFYWPYWLVNLRDRSEESRFELPRVGYSSTEGYFIKGTYLYFINRQHYGVVYADYMTRLGVGGGVRHHWDLGDPRFSLYTYAQPNQVTDHLDLQGIFEANSSLGGRGNLRLSTQYRSRSTITSITEDWTNQFSLNLNTDKTRNSLSLQHLYYISGQTGQSWTANLNHNFLFTPNLRLAATASHNFSDRSDMPARDVLSYDLSLNHSGTISSSIRWQQSHNTQEEATMWLSMRRQPEFLINGRINLAQYLPGTWPALTWRGTLGRYLVFPGPVQGGMARIELALSRQTFQLHPWVTLRADASVTPSLTVPWGEWEAVQSQWVLRGWSGVEIRPPGPFNLQASYNRQDVFGTSLLAFNTALPAESVNGTLNFDAGPVFASVSGSYNLLTEKPGESRIRARIRPGTWLSMEGNLAYSWENQRMSSYGGSLSLNPHQRISLTTSGQYNPITSVWSSYQLQGKLGLTQYWSVSAAQTWDGVNNRLASGRIQLQHEADCRTWSFAYDQVNQAFWIEFEIKAFPNRPLKLGAGRHSIQFDTSLFDPFGESSPEPEF